MQVRDTCISNYNRFCCLQKFNLFPKIEYHSLFSDLFILLYLCWKCVTILLKIWEVKIFIFGDVSGPMAAKWPKVNRRLKIVNYFTCVRHFSCRWYWVQEVDLNGYPRISNPYCRDIEIRTCEWTQGKKWPKVNHQLKIAQISLHVCGTSSVGGTDPQKLI